MTALRILTFLLATVVITGGQMLGGFKHRDDHHNDPHIREVAQLAIQRIQAERNEQLELVKVVSVQTQVVAGMNYRFVLDTATPSQELHTFEATVYEPLGGQEPTLSSHKLLPKAEADQQVESASERSKPALLGAYKDVHTLNSDVQAAAQFAAEQLSEQSNSLVPLKLASVLKARTKVAAGMLFDLQLKLSQDKAADQIVQVEVQRSLGNSFTLQSSNTSAA